MNPRLASKIEVSALIRRAEHLGGTAAVLARGDDTAGSILLYVADRGVFRTFLERRLDPQGRYRWERSGPQDVEDEDTLSAYMSRRRAIDGDLWVVELDIAGSERLIAEMTAVG